DVETQLSQSKGRGNPLPEQVRAYMEPRFGADFSQVRVHTGSDSIHMNRAVGAQAFTSGSDIYFGEGRNPTNLELTAHELTHVIQQNGDRIHTKLTVSVPGEALERETDQIANSISQAQHQTEQARDLGSLYEPEVSLEEEGKKKGSHA